MSLFIQQRADAEAGSMAVTGIERIFHINVVCRDLERSLRFYVDILGMHVVDGPCLPYSAPQKHSVPFCTPKKG